MYLVGSEAAHATYVRNMTDAIWHWLFLAREHRGPYKTNRTHSHRSASGCMPSCQWQVPPASPTHLGNASLPGMDSFPGAEPVCAKPETWTSARVCGMYKATSSVAQGHKYPIIIAV